MQCLLRHFASLLEHSKMQSTSLIASSRCSALQTAPSRRVARQNPLAKVNFTACCYVARPNLSGDHACEHPSQELLQLQPCRRSLIGSSLMLSAGLVLSNLFEASSASAFSPPPPGYRLQVDKLDGYSFLYPESWLAVTSSGNDIFLRNPRNIDENLFIELSSPSSSRYESVADFGKTPKDAANNILDQYLVREFMSTRIGIRREGKILYAESRTGSDGREFYDIAIRMTSYGSKNAYVATREEVMKDYGVEWDRVLVTTLAAANNRLYELRFQTANATYEASKPIIDKVTKSFSVFEVDSTPSVQLPSSLRAARS